MDSPTVPLSTSPIDTARRVLHAQSAALRAVADRIDESFTAAAELLANCQGRVCLTGVGKSLDVAGKIAGSFCSTGTRSYVLDPTKALHGDLGMLHEDDVILALSHSGETEELIRVLGPFRDLARSLVALTSHPTSTLARAADAVIAYGPVEETDPLALAPSTSTTVMIALGDALAAELSRRRQFSPEEFARFHPSGSLGLKLARVEAMMRTGDAVRIARCDLTVRHVFVDGKHSRRRTGAVMLVDASDRLVGLFTDSDLAKLFENRLDAAFDGPVSDVMTRNPLTVEVGTRVGAALELMRSRKISELPVVDGLGRPAGLLDVTDLIGLPTRADATNVRVRLRESA